MENQFFLNGGGMSHHHHQHHHHPIQFETWQHHNPNPNPNPLSSSSSSMEIQQQNILNCSPENNNNHQNQDSFFNSDHNNLQFDSSALSSMVSSPSTAAAASNFNMIQNDNSFVIRELIGKLGTIGGASAEISPHSQTVAVYNNNTPSSSCYSTPLNSPPKLNMPKPPPPSSSMALNSATVAEFSADPGFAERAAKFSCFGSRSFNGRTTTTTATTTTAPNSPLVMMNNNIGSNNGAELTHQRSNHQIHRVSSSPSLKSLGSHQMENNNNKNNVNNKICSTEVAAANSSQEESTISEQNPNVEGAAGAALKIASSSEMSSRKRKGSSSRGKPKENPTSTTTKGGEGSEESNAKRSKGNEGEGNENNGRVKVEEESKGGGEEKQQNKSNNSKPPEPPKDYIHVRARRGQATDSHSLAERVRREKISERMKLLQDLVPGCNKVTGKALMLDEIINYVQSLQRQVEFLSMKLASVNTRMDLSIESIVPKDIFQSNHSSMAHPIFPIESSAAPFYGHHQSQQNPVIHNNIPNGSVSHNSVDPLDSALCQTLAMQLPQLNAFNEIGSQFPLTFCEDDLHTIVQMGFGQTSNRTTPIHSPSFDGSNQGSQMKVEL